MRYKQPLSSYRYVSRPVVIEAVPVGDLIKGTDRLPIWVYRLHGSAWDYYGEGIRVTTLEGAMIGGPTDMLIRGTAGELYPCKLDIFEAKYEAVE